MNTAENINSGKFVSIILPVFNEEGSLRHFFDTLKNEIAKLPQYDFEFIFINDGSSDGSMEIIEGIMEADSRAKSISFTRNFGHQAALLCGIKYSRGNAIITMDSDLQHPPDKLALLLEKWEEGYDIVNTLRVDGERTAYFKKWASRWFYKVFNIISEVNIPHASADFRLISRNVADVIVREVKEKNIFLRGLVSWMGYKQAVVKYNAADRITGRSKYTVRKMFSLANSGVSYYTLIPIKLGLFLGMALFSVSFLYLLISIIYGLSTGTLVPGWTSIIFVFLLVSSFQFIFIGILGIYIGHIFTEIKNRPMYIVDQKRGFD